MGSGLLRAVDAVTVRIPDLDAGLAFYLESLGHQLRWRNDEIGLVSTFEIPVGRVAVMSDPFGNPLVLVDLSKGRYEVKADGSVTGVA